MALNGTITASAPTRYGLISRGDRQDLVLTLPCAATADINANDLLVLSSSYVTPCTAVTDKVCGMATETKDNSSGSAGDLNVGVCVRGIIIQDGLTASATHTSLAVGTPLYLAPAVSSYCAVAQALSASTANSAVEVGKCLDVVTAPGSGSQINAVRCLIDLADQAVDWV